MCVSSGECSIPGCLQCGCPMLCAVYLDVCSVSVQWCVQYTWMSAVWVSSGECSIPGCLQCGCPVVCVVYLAVCSVGVQW